MGRSFYDVNHGALPNGGGFTTADWENVQDAFTAAKPALDAQIVSANAVITGLISDDAMLGVTGTLSGSVNAYSVAYLGGI